MNLQLNTVETHHSYFEIFEVKTGQIWGVANLPPKPCPQKIIGLQLN